MNSIENVKDCTNILLHTHIHTSTVLYRLWFTGHFTPSWGGHLQRWPCIAAQGHRYSIWQHFPKNPQAQTETVLSIFTYEGFNLVPWRSKMHSCFHIGQSLHCYSQFVERAGLHCSMLCQTLSATVCARIYNSLVTQICRRKSAACRWLSWMTYEEREIEVTLLRTCQCVFYWQTCFIWLRHCKDTLSSEWRKRLTEKAENSSVEGHILTLHQY